jgi:sensor domain CHASE-containing protein
MHKKSIQHKWQFLKQNWIYWLVILLIAVLTLMIWRRQENIGRLEKKLHETVSSIHFKINHPKTGKNEKEFSRFIECAVN